MLAADCGQAVIDALPDAVLPGDAVPDEVVTRFALPDDVTWCGLAPAGPREEMPFDAPPADPVPCDTGSWDELQSFEAAEFESLPWQTTDFASDDAWLDESWSGECWPMPVDPIDVRSQFVWSDPGWASYSYVVSPDGLLTDISVVASYDEPTVAAFVAEHRDDGSVQIEDLGDCWLICGFPADLAPPVPEYRVCFFAACGGGFGMDATESGMGMVEDFDVAADWSWQDGLADATVDDGSYQVERAFGMPLFYARGTTLPEEAVGETVAVQEPTPTAHVGAMSAESTDTANPAATAFDPRAAAFADMRMMVAAASLPQGVAEAGTFGGGRRRR